MLRRRVLDAQYQQDYRTKNHWRYPNVSHHRLLVRRQNEQDGSAVSVRKDFPALSAQQEKIEWEAAPTQ
jgi:hypothetical protein